MQSIAPLKVSTEQEVVITDAVREAARVAGVYGIGFIDPNTVNAYVLENQYTTKDTEKSLLIFLKKLNITGEILLPYNFKSVPLSCTTNYSFAYSML